MELQYETTTKGRTLYDKVFADHVVDRQEDGTCLIYIDRHLVHEVTTPQAFEGLRTAGRSVRRPDCTLATVDHNVPTDDRSDFQDAASFITEKDSRLQVMTFEQNVKDFGLVYFNLTDQRQGIVHVIGPEQGFTLPGVTMVCGDSHTSTHGAFGALAFGIGTSEVEHVLATQTLTMTQSKNMKVEVEGELPEGATSKDLMLHIIGVMGTAGGTGHVMEFVGDAISKLSMEARMSMCNMAIEAGARAGMVAPDETTFAYIEGRPMAPKGAAFEKAKEYWKTLKTDENAVFDKVVKVNAGDVLPIVTWGTSPQDVMPITGRIPDPENETNPTRKAAIKRSLEYQGLEPNQPIEGVKVDKVFIGSCTNSRIEDLRLAASIAKGRKVADGVHAMIVPGSGLVKKQAVMEGLDKIFKDAGFDWREPGCSMCLGMNPDILSPKQRCASTSNRNFEGRQGAYGRTHLVSPVMAAAAAIAGHFTDARKMQRSSISSDVEFKTTELGGNDDILPPPPVLKDGSAASSDKGDAPALEPFKVVKGLAAPLNMDNVDTDMIIPKQFLKTILKSGLGKHAFFGLRYLEDGRENPDFVLNQSPYKDGCKVLVCGENFGCGSSREHAPWSIKDLGIKCLVSTSFADIFFNNCFKNGMLCVKLPKDQVDTLMRDAKEKKDLEFNLPDQVIVRDNGEKIAFEVDAFYKHCLLNGLDTIGLTMQKDALISAFESKRTASYPWLNGAGYKPGN